jgi:hypothetical protein
VFDKYGINPSGGKLPIMPAVGRNGVRARPRPVSSSYTHQAPDDTAYSHTVVGGDNGIAKNMETQGNLSGFLL